MDSDFFRQQNTAMRAALAHGLRCDPDAFAREELTLVARPEPPSWPYTAAIIGFGTGTVVSLEERYMEWAKGAAPEPHYRVNYNGFLYPFVQEGERRGEKLAAIQPGLGWALGSPPANVPVPAGLRLEKVNSEWMAAHQPTDVFKNGIGGASEAHRTFRNQFAYVLFDGDQPVAVAGAFDTWDMLEIGIDVVRSHRGRNLAPVVVTAATRDILEQSRTPYYSCATTNIRSQRTALASGFIPACSIANVVPAAMAE